MEPDIGDALPAFRAIQIAQRHRWDPHLVGIRARQKPQPENLKPVARGHAVQIFIYRAHQNLIPEAADGPLGLVLFAQPIEHRDSIQILAPPMLAADGPKRRGDRELVGSSQEISNPQKLPVKCSGAGSPPACNTEVRPPGSIKKNCL